MPDLFQTRGINYAYHYSPLHYLPFIAREKALLSKSELVRRGFSGSHFRSTSSGADKRRGFAHYLHFSLTAQPPILLAKLQRGFPHFEIRVPTSILEKMTTHLCRFNIARSRYLRRPGRPGPQATPQNGTYHGDKQLPTGETARECAQVLDLNRHSAVELLVPKRLDLSAETHLIFFAKDDLALARKVLTQLECPLPMELSSQGYSRRASHVAAVKRFIDAALADSDWRGNGLEFDRL